MGYGAGSKRCPSGEERSQLPGLPYSWLPWSDERMAEPVMRAVRLSFQEELDRIQASLQEEGELVLRSLRACMKALEQQDLELADEVISFDDVVDRLLRLGGDESRLEWGLRILLVSRCLERIGDHAVDIGEQTAYLVTGEFREFTDASHPEGRPV